jgi:hypothetical protein
VLVVVEFVVATALCVAPPLPLSKKHSKVDSNESTMDDYSVTQLVTRALCERGDCLLFDRRRWHDAR